MERSTVLEEKSLELGGKTPSLDNIQEKAAKESLVCTHCIINRVGTGSGIVCLFFTAGSSISFTSAIRASRGRFESHSAGR